MSNNEKDAADSTGGAGMTEFEKHVAAEEEWDENQRKKAEAEALLSKSLHDAIKANKKIGWIGTGVMGKSMAGHLIKNGYTLLVHNRTKSKADDLI